MEDNIDMLVGTPQQFLRAIRLSQNGFFRDVHIAVSNKNRSFSGERELVKDIHLGVEGMFKRNMGGFANAQQTSYKIKTIADPLGRHARTDITMMYLSSGKEKNDLICVCAEIAGILLGRLNNPNDEIEKVKAVDEWVKKTFDYRQTESPRDHSAVGLLSTRGGVCQAIAALATIILNYMGVAALYISGDGYGSGGWGPHAWNAVKIGGEWIHVDLTFSMGSLRLPSTRTLAEKKLFMYSHRWDRQNINDITLDAEWDSLYRRKSLVCLETDKDRFNIDGITVISGYPIMKKNQRNLFVDMGLLVRLLGGGVELDSAKNNLNICLNNRRLVIPGVQRYLWDGLFEFEILKSVFEMHVIGRKLFLSCGI